MTTPSGDPWLLTPGPLTTTDTTKQAMLHDWGSRDETFIETNSRVLKQLVDIAGANASHVAVPVQGSGTFAVEATIATLVPKNGKALVLINGAYGHRMVKILDYLGRDCIILQTPEDTIPDLAELDKTLNENSDITHVLAVHCETTSGILNPIHDIAVIVSNHGRALIIDAMSAFGAIELDARSTPFTALMASSNKCLEGVPGLGFAIIQKSALEKCEGNAHSLSLDLYDQWQVMEKTKQWRFTPPTHVIAAFDAAIKQFIAEGGVKARGKRYQNNCDVLITGMRDMGFETLLPDDLQAPIIITFKMPADKNFVFDDFYNRLKDQGFVIYPGKLTVAPSFRIGCIGALGENEIRQALSAIKSTIQIMGVQQTGVAA